MADQIVFTSTVATNEVSFDSSNDTFTTINFEGQVAVAPEGPQGEQGLPGQGVAEGGTTGQLLKKDSPDDYDTSWTTLTKSDIGLGNVDNTTDASKPISTLTQAAIDTKEAVANKSTSTSLGSSDTLYPSQNAVKTYVDTQVSASTTPTATITSEGKVLQREYNIRDFGAMIDGSTDDTSAIQDAIDASEAAGGGFVFIPEGTTLISSTIILKNHVHLIGSGDGASVIKVKNSSNVTAIKNYVSPDTIVANAEFFAISNIRIDGNKANNASAGNNGIEISSNPLNNMATGDEWYDMHYALNGVMVINCTGTGFVASGRSEGMLEDVYVEKCDAGGFDTSYDTGLVNCRAGNNGTFGFKFDNGNIYASNCKAFISGNQAATNVPGFLISGLVQGSTLTSCIAQNNNGDGFLIEDCSGVTLAGCVADSNNNGTGNTDQQFVGFCLDNSYRCNIQGVSTWGTQGGSPIGKQKSQVRLINGSDKNNINLTVAIDGLNTPAGDLSDDSLNILNNIIINGTIVSSGDTASVSRDYNTSQNGPRVRGYKRGGTTDSHGVVLNGGEMLGITGFGWDGSAYYEAARISMAAAQDFTGANGGSGILFYTTANNSHTQALGLQIRQNKSVLFYGDPLPNTNNGFNLGGASNRWLGIYGNSLVLATTSKTANYTATTSDYLILCNATSAGFTITLPAAASNSGRVYIIKKTDSSGNNVTVDGNASETIDGATTAVLSAQWASITIQCDGSNWFIT